MEAPHRSSARANPASPGAALETVSPTIFPSTRGECRCPCLLRPVVEAFEHSASSLVGTDLFAPGKPSVRNGIVVTGLLQA